MKNIAVFGVSGAIGKEFVSQMASKYSDATIYAFGRSVSEQQVGNISFHNIDYEAEVSLEHAASVICKDVQIDMVVVAVGILHDTLATPEKSLEELSAEKLHHLYQINAVIPMLIAKYFIPNLHKDQQSIFACMSARIGSISDNRLGGWYSYRASKAALNMLLKTLSIEYSRVNEQGIIVGLHPGTVDSPLSKPFQANVPAKKLFTPQVAVEHLMKVLSRLTAKESGKCFGWDGGEIEP